MKIKTPWFPPSIKPVHIGEYETRIHGMSCFICMGIWTGHRWLFARDGQPCVIQTRDWRGLTEKQS